ncbi:protein GET1 [Kwoniella mangroviensis CBS 8886]|uniref:uncharacterized protein n=1 Tax=Kwoniella mangroviensis CBS 8507 TaxID=1296122 RepID=UPI00080CE8C8|nr:protein GET1 [Kwoniella mangroviensis CBS 8507]OCF70029.1 protein GET1 [Kwoniella mangroviensis CBS 8507]OCF75807.1 protein GET1 [Kwoniella mangroviensis CBS 8886]
MANLALLIFLVVLLTQVVAWVGQTVLQDIAFSIYSRIALSKASKEQSILRKQILQDKAELGKTSSQDEFAKWAKIRRRLDKALADLERLNNTINTSKSSFTTKFKSFIWVITFGSKLILVWWYRKQPVFWLPQGWVPYPVAWLISFPSAPIGSVSSGAWSAVCTRVLISLEEIVKALLEPSTPAGPIPTASFPSASEKQEAKIEPITLEHEKLD